MKNPTMPENQAVVTVDAQCSRCGNDKALPTPGAHVVRCTKCGKNFNPTERSKK